MTRKKSIKWEQSKTHASGIEVKEGDILEMWPDMLLHIKPEKVKIIKLDNGDLGYIYFDRLNPSIYSLKHNNIHGCRIINS